MVVAFLHNIVMWLCYAMQVKSASSDTDEEDDGDLFEPKRRSVSEADDRDPDALDAPDSSRVPMDDSLLHKWSEASRAQKLRNRFVTGRLTTHLTCSSANVSETVAIPGCFWVQRLPL